MAERHVLRGREIVAHQRERVELSKRFGRSNEGCERLLAEFARSLAIFEDDLARLRHRRQGQPRYRSLS